MTKLNQPNVFASFIQLTDFKLKSNKFGCNRVNILVQMCSTNQLITILSVIFSIFEIN